MTHPHRTLRRIAAPLTAPLTAIAAVAVLLASAAPAQAGGSLRDRWRERIATRMAEADKNAPAAPAPLTLAYGTDPLQTIDIWRAQGANGPAPLVIFVHGGAWKLGDKDNATGKWKPVHYPGEGYVFASVDYRLVPNATVEQQAGDVAHAVRALVDHAADYGIDPRRIVLIGHSAGAHLVALVGTDESYLRGAGLSLRDIAGVVPIDGAAYDVPRQIKDGGGRMRSTYIEVFGTDPARQRRLSPVFHAAAPNAPRFLLPHVQRPDGIRQSEELAAALRKAGTSVELGSYPGEGLRGHMEINRRLGDPAYAPTADIDRWLATTFGR